MPHKCPNALQCLFGSPESRLCNRMFSSVPIRLSAALKALDAADHLEQEPSGSGRAIAGIGSRVRFFERATAEFHSVVLVRPEQPSTNSRVSILSPLGASLLGCKIGDSIEVTLRGCTARLLILNVAFEPGAPITKPLKWFAPHPSARTRLVGTQHCSSHR